MECSFRHGLMRYFPCLILQKKYAGYEAQTLTDEVNEKRCIIMETSTPEEVLRQEGVINEVLFRTQTVLEEYPGSTDEMNTSNVWTR